MLFPLKLVDAAGKLEEINGEDQAMTPLERINHHLKELEAAFRDYYPDSKTYATRPLYY